MFSLFMNFILIVSDPYESLEGRFCLSQMGFKMHQVVSFFFPKIKLWELIRSKSCGKKINSGFARLRSAGSACVWLRCVGYAWQLGWAGVSGWVGGLLCPSTRDCPFSATGVRAEGDEPDGLVLNYWWYLQLLPKTERNIWREGGRGTFLLCPVSSSLLYLIFFPSPQSVLSHLSFYFFFFPSPQTGHFGEEQPPHKACALSRPASPAAGAAWRAAVGLLRWFRWERERDFISLLYKRLTNPWNGAGCLLPAAVLREGSGLQRIMHYKYWNSAVNISNLITGSGNSL